MIRTTALALLLAAASATHAAIDIVRVWTGHRAADDFASIREHFGSGERTGGETVLRTTAGDRAGFYFLVRAEGAAARVRLQWVPWDGTAAVERTWDLPAGATDDAILLGLTGPEAPPAGREPLAWRLSFVDPEGAELAVRESFLWKAP